MKFEGKLIGCMVHYENLYSWLNEREGAAVKPPTYEGLRLYSAPDVIYAIRERLAQLGYEVSEIEERGDSQTELFLTDDYGYAHFFGVSTSG
jgi:hypothetical protein